jgi:hypothetical protein
VLLYCFSLQIHFDTVIKHFRVIDVQYLTKHREAHNVEELNLDANLATKILLPKHGSEVIPPRISQSGFILILVLLNVVAANIQNP